MTATLTKDQIIERLYTGKNFNDCIGKMQPEYLRDDLRAEVILVVCEWSDEKVVKLYSEGVLEFYVVRVILNTIKSNTSPFAKKYRQQLLEYNTDDPDDCGDAARRKHLESVAEKVSVRQADQPDELEERQLREDLEDATLADISNLYWYDAELVRLYMKHGNFRAIERETGIPFASCYKNVRKSLDLLKRRAKGEVVNVPGVLFSRDELKGIQDGALKLKNSKL